jgi:CHAT domain-containing protein
VLLRDRLWNPLATHLAGIETVLISPDGDLSRLPFAALPGTKDDKYLIEERSIAILPVPRFLPDLFDATAVPSMEPSLLVVGDVDYGADPGGQHPIHGSDRTAVRGGVVGGWKPLPATRQESESIKDSFVKAFPKGKVERLQLAEPTEEAVRQELGTCRWVHLATHGFFAPPQVKAIGTDRDRQRNEATRAASDYHPGVLSGVVLAGANRPSDPNRDDGILTAAEVGTLDLRQVELVVLSTCETGLGPSAGGEGVLGLQRAFQVAGVRTTITSLWKVRDEETRALMTRCYENWLTKKQGKLAGLAEAQRWMLKDGIAQGVVRQEEGFARKSGPASPYVWAGFVLAGDWR